ncbi:hypothetical protein DPEC_G00137780 [Dallia pectoralis]|uniref:Uncharacterized protein n=1 Tax=Dallia pectoralis TaxID=75939 RepID=A0ACC2GMA5_DALPE|nr:hypothetical protein DPEC_G00137780 [Dallia pectoralis]
MDCIFVLVSILFVVTSENLEKFNALVGEPVLLICELPELATPINTAETRIIWQDGTDKVLHAIDKGQEAFQHQDPWYKNRTTFDLDHLASGNLSLLLNPVNVGDDQMTLTVIRISDISEKVCQCRVYVAARYQKPTVTHINSTVECHTQGGFPSGQVTWMTNNGPLDPAEADNRDSQHPETKTYNISSRVNGTGSQNMTCSIHNPVLNETQRTTIDLRPVPNLPDSNPSNNLSVLGAVIGAVIVGVLIVFYFRRYKLFCFSQAEPNPPELQSVYF